MRESKSTLATLCVGVRIDSLLVPSAVVPGLVGLDKADRR